jgi:hypothetical protein
MNAKAGVRCVLMAMFSATFACGGQDAVDGALAAAGAGGRAAGPTGGTGGTVLDAHSSASGGGAGSAGSAGMQTGGGAGNGGAQTGSGAGNGGAQTGGDAGNGGMQTGGDAGNGGAQTGGGGMGGSGGAIACPASTMPSDCSEVPNFQCGFGASCDGTTISVQWHVHRMCADGERISGYWCTYRCPSGCLSTTGWPSSGTDLVATMCAGGNPDGGGPPKSDGGVDPSCVSETDTAFCSRLGKNCGGVTAGDNCGRPRIVASCGTCLSTRTCGGGATQNRCGCTPETDASFCARFGKSCGSVTAGDNCGTARTVADCGWCLPPQICGGTGAPNTCGNTSEPDGGACTAETDAALCARFGKNCGALTAMDNCGGARTVSSCGTCIAQQTCGGGGTPNVCGCTAETDADLCARYGKNCGSVRAPDNCGAPRTVASCGQCDSPQSYCGGDGIPNVCGKTGCTQGPIGPRAYPFPVDMYFNATGWTGDAAIAAGCPVRSPAPLVGSKCWTASVKALSVAGARFGGIQWQYPDNNWGSSDGRGIPADAKKVHFVAWSPAGGETVEFQVGNGNGNTDGFRVSTTVKLTTTPTPYEISLEGVQYRCLSVRTGFAWFAEGAPAAMTFYVDDIQWQ